MVGAGLAGSAAAWRLAARGRDVVLVEAAAPAHLGGSSHGSARIFRHAYPDPFWVGLTVRALDGWRELHDGSGRDVLTTTGGLDFGPRHDLPALVEAMSAQGLPTETLQPEAARERWPQLSVDGPVLHQPGAGVIDAAVAVEAMVGEARRHGARLLVDRVVAVETVGERARVVLEHDDAIVASAVVVAAGAWLPELAPRLPTGVAERLPPLVVTRQQVFHLPFPEPPTRPEDWPVFIHQGEHMVYSLPGGRDAGHSGFKIAEHDAGTPTTASSRDGFVDAASRTRVVDLVRRLLPAVDATPYAETTCLYTSTPTEDFVIDRVGPVVIASPCSGHGAKFAPLTGELVADVAAGADPLPRFRLG